MACSNSIPPKKMLHIEAIQSITPGNITEPGQSRRINLDAPLRNETLQSHLRVVLYYNNHKNSDGGSGVEHHSATEVAAWTKETMSMALSEHPVLAGRLRRDHEGDGYWEVKYNDAGVRMIQASAEATMAEFLELENREGREGVLAYWMDVDREHPELSALFYVQVTEFQGGGYTVGMSCSLLLSDPMLLAQFLKKWAVSHSSILAQAHPQTPMFHLGYFTKTKHPNHLKSIPLLHDSSSSPTTILFKLPYHDHSQTTTITSNALASHCIQETTRRLEAPTSVSKFALIVNQPTGELRVVEALDKQDLVHSDAFGVGALDVASWDELALDELALGEENKPGLVSCSVVSCGSKGLVVVMPPSHDHAVSELLISVTVPCEKK